MKINSKFITTPLITGMLLSSIPAMAQNNDIIEVYINNEQVVFDVNPIIENERTLVPLRAIFEALGAEVTWDQGTRTASATRGTDTVSITIDSNVLYKNDTAVALDVPAKIVDERTLVPVRAISESFDAEVTWVQETQSVYIVTKDDAETPGEATTEPAEDKILMTLSDEDMQNLIDQKAAIRYGFEQVYLPQYVFENETLYDDMKSFETIFDTFIHVWNANAIEYILQIQENSETVYNIDENTDIFASYDHILKTAELSPDVVFDGGGCTEADDGTRFAILMFKSADQLVECKYIAIVKSKDGDTRYFTAENDPLQADKWFFCEVYSEGGRGSLVLFPKTNDMATDVEMFTQIAYSMYTDGNASN